MAICTKQSIGITLAVITVIYKAIYIQSKGQFKEYVKSAVVRIIGILIPVVILFLYLVITQSLSDFVNYAILGISTFSNKISYLTLFQSDKIEIKLLSVTVPLTLLIMSITIINQILKKENSKMKNILTLLLYSLSIIIVMYPISDEIHFLIGSTITIISLIYLIYLHCKMLYDKINFNKKKKIYKILSLIIWVCIFALILFTAMKNLYNYVITEKSTQINHYENTKKIEQLEIGISEIDNYILEQEEQGKKVYILDAVAVVYMIPLDNYNKDYDMFLKGNIGKDGEIGQIEKIKQRNEDTIYLLRKKDLSLNWQTPRTVLDYVRENLENIGEVNIFEIYK